MRRRLTREGRPYTVAAFVRETAPCVYWNGRPKPLAFIVSMQFRYVLDELARGNIRRAIYKRTP